MPLIPSMTLYSITDVQMIVRTNRLRLSPLELPMASTRSSAPKTSSASPAAASQETAPAFGALHFSAETSIVTMSMAMGTAARTTLRTFSSGPLEGTCRTAPFPKRGVDGL